MPWQYWLRLGLAGFSMVLMASSLLYAVVWVPLRLFKKSDKDQYLSLRLLPLLPALTFVGIIVLLILSTITANNPIELFGGPTPWSVGIFLLTLVFGLASLASLIQAVRALRWNVSTTLKIYSLLVSMANMTVTTFLAYWGVIGFRIWI